MSRDRSVAAERRAARLLARINRRRTRLGLIPRLRRDLHRRAIRFCALNLPSHDDKRRLAEPGRRAPLAFLAVGANLRTVVGISELATISRRWIATLPHWRLVAARPNNVFAGGRRTLGNGTAYRRRLYKLLHVQHHHVPMPGRPRGLNFVELTLQIRATGQVFHTAHLHGPRRKLDPATNHAVIRLGLALLRGWRDAGVAGEVDADFNNGAAGRMFRLAGFTVAAGRGVDWIITTGMRTLQRHDTDGGAFSDHHVVMADSELVA